MAGVKIVAKRIPLRVILDVFDATAKRSPKGRAEHKSEDDAAAVRDDAIRLSHCFETFIQRKLTGPPLEI